MTTTFPSDPPVPLLEVTDDPTHPARAALAETFGYGKSLCYQIPALLLPGLTLVVSPLIALMKDQIDQLTRRGVAAGRLDSTLTSDEVRALMEAIRKGT